MMDESKDKPLVPTKRPASPWERIEQRDAALKARIAALEERINDLPLEAIARALEEIKGNFKQVDEAINEIYAALERARIPRWPNGTPDAADTR